MFQLSPWRVHPEHILVQCSQVWEMPGRDEFIVQFDTNHGHYTSFVPKQNMDAPNRRMHACIVADVADGVLILLPADTLTSGPRLLVDRSEMHDLIVSAD